MKTILIMISIIMISACSSTTKTEYIELPPVVQKEYVFIECNVPAELLETNDIEIKKEKAIEVLKKIATETNDRKRKIEAIKGIECIKAN